MSKRFNVYTSRKMHTILKTIAAEEEVTLTELLLDAVQEKYKERIAKKSEKASGLAVNAEVSDG